jgi:hypothetical protein
VVAARGRCRDDGNRKRRHQRAGRQKSPKIRGVRRGDSGDREGAREGRDKTELMAENEWARAQRHRAREDHKASVRIQHVEEVNLGMD